MGVCISHELLQREKDIKTTLDNTESFAEILKENQVDKTGISMMVRRLSKYQLFIDIGGCETLAFDFRKTDEIDWQEAQYAVLLKEAKARNTSLIAHADRMKVHSVSIDTVGNEIYISRGFCKTQYGRDIEHKFVAEILRFVASQCYGVIINDEGDYYYSHDLKDAVEAKAANKAVLDSVVKKFKE